MTQTKPTREDVETLKIQWLHDPIWDIEHTEGFEEFEDELKEYRERIEEKKEKQREKEMTLKAEKIGVPGNTKLAAYIEYMEWRIKQLELTVIELTA